MRGKYFIYSLFGVVFCVGLFLRLESFFTKTFAFTYDVGRDLIAVQSIVNTYKIPLIGPTTGQPGLFYGPWWYYILLPPFLLSRGDPAGIAFFITLTGIASIWLGILIGKKLGGQELGLFIGSLLTLSPVLIGISSQIWSPNLIPFFVVLSIYLLYSEDSFLKPILRYIGIGFFAGFILDSGIVFGTLWIIAVIVSSILFRKKISRSMVLWFIVGLLITLMPRILFEIRHEFLMTKTLFSFFSQIPQNDTSSFHIQDSIKAMLGYWNETIGSTSIVGNMLLALTAGSLFFFFKQATNKIQGLILLCVVILTCYFIGLSLFPDTIWNHYIVGLPVIYTFLIAVSIWLFGRKNKNSFIRFILFGIIIVTMLNPIRLYQRLTGPPWKGDVSVYKNQLQVIDYIYKDADKKPFKYIVYTPPVHDFTYKYLFSWYGLNTYKYTPVDTAELFYLILEPDDQYPDRLKDWLVARETDGTIIQEVTLDGQITVQKRLTVMTK